MPEIINENKKRSTIVMAIGVGGGGGNAVNHLYTYGEKEITYMLCNTDRQALENSPIPENYKVQLGKDGLGAGNEASSGALLAEESAEDVKKVLVESDIKMAFVVAGMGGGTGTGAAPVIAKIAKDLGILTIGVVTIPFEEEGYHRINQAIAGVDALSKNVDSLIIINNTNIAEMYGDLPMRKAYFQSNEIIAKAVKSISDIINKHLLVNVDFADVCKVMRDSGVALMGTGIASGENRAIVATEQALTSPLLQNQDITGAKNVLVCLISSEDENYEITMGDVRNVPAYIQKRTRTSNETDIIWGAGYDNQLGDKIQAIVIATGFNVQNIPAMKAYYAATLSAAEKLNPESTEKESGPVVHHLDEDEDTSDRRSAVNFYDEPVKVKSPGANSYGSRISVEDDSNEPFIISQPGKKGSTPGASAPSVLTLEDDEPQEGGYTTTYPVKPEPPVQDEPTSDEDDEGEDHKGLFGAVKDFFKGALVDNDDRH